MSRATKERPVTADDFRRTFEVLRSKGVDDSAVDFQKLADEENRYLERSVAGWSAPKPPGGWLVKDEGPITMYVNPQSRLKVGLSCAVENDGRAWIHFSLSHPKRIPTWGELTTAKDAFLGDREAYQILPPRKRWVSIHPNVLNLFALFDEKESVLPDFTRGTGGI